MTLKPTGPVSPNDPGAQTIIPPSSPPAEKSGVRVISAGFAVNLDADVLVDGMSRAALEHIRTSILTGQRPDGGGAQARLGIRAAAVPNRVTPHRGARTGHLADNMHRTEITGTTGRASTKIEPPDDRIVYVRKEAKLGRELITARGKAADVAQAEAERLVGEMAQGQGFRGETSEMEAKKV